MSETVRVTLWWNDTLFGGDVEISSGKINADCFAEKHNIKFDCEKKIRARMKNSISKIISEDYLCV